MTATSENVKAEGVFFKDVEQFGITFLQSMMSPI